MEKQTTISTYHEYISEGILILRHGLSLVKKGDNQSGDSNLLGEINCRYAFLMFANSIEAAANALIISLGKDSNFYEEIEKLGTLLKFEIFCELSSRKLDRGNINFARIRELISCRNDFVHPKPRMVSYEINPKTFGIDYKIKRTKSRNYPAYFSEIKPNDALNALDDTLKFMSWICFDICGFELQEGAFKLGLNSFGSTGDINIIEAEYSKRFEKRSLGVSD